MVRSAIQTGRTKEIEKIVKNASNRALMVYIFHILHETPANDGAVRR